MTTSIDTESVRREVMAVVKRWDMGPEQAAQVIAAVQRGLNPVTARARPDEAGLRDYERLNTLRDAIIEAIRAQDGVGGIKAFAAYDDFLHRESLALRAVPVAGAEDVWLGPEYAAALADHLGVALPEDDGND